MNWRLYFRARRGRGWSLPALGPNEARILFDLALAVGAWGGAVAFLRFFAPAAAVAPGWALLLPPLFLAGNLAAGVYTRLRLAPALTKCAALTVSVAAACGLAWILGVAPPLLVLWALLTLPTAVAARVLLGLTYSSRAPLTTLAATPHGHVLVIGGAGYIGATTVQRLLERGHRVRVLDRLMYGTESLAPFKDSANFELLQGDATDISKLTTAMRQASAVVHLGGLVGDPACSVDPDFTRHANIIATRMAKEVARALGVRRFVFASSCSVYGASEHEMHEDGALNPVSLYAQTKLESERELLRTVSDDFFVTILRFATVFGHSARPRFDLVANLFVAQAMTQGTITVIGPHQWRPFVHVRDLARAIVTVLEARPTLVQSQIYNVGDDRLNLTIGQLGERAAAVVRQYRDVQVVVQDGLGDPRNYRVSFEKIRAHLGFRSETMIDDGLREIAENIRSGRYNDYRDAIYSNLATTRAALQDFRESPDLYAPLHAV
jgi:nucleoside-diphosphate-sugar epimerase